MGLPRQWYFFVAPTKTAKQVAPPRRCTWVVLICYLQYPADWNPETMAAQTASTPAALVMADWHDVASVPERVAQQAAAAAHPVLVAVAVDVAVAVTVEAVQYPAVVYDETSWAHWASV